MTIVGECMRCRCSLHLEDGKIEDVYDEDLNIVGLLCEECVAEEEEDCI